MIICLMATMIYLYKNNEGEASINVGAGGFGGKQNRITCNSH